MTRGQAPARTKKPGYRGDGDRVWVSNGPFRNSVLGRFSEGCNTPAEGMCASGPATNGTVRRWELKTT